MDKKTYGPKEVCKLCGVSARQLGYWKLIGIVRPRQELHGSKIFHRYTGRDLDLLKAVRKLTQEGYRVSKAAEKIKAALANGEEISPEELLGMAGSPMPFQTEPFHVSGSGMEAFQKRLAEEVARAHRFHLPLSCLAIRVDVSPARNEDAVRRATDEAEKTLITYKRAFDVVVRADRQEFLWLLCQTPLEGAQAVAAHVQERLDRSERVIDGERYSVRSRIGASSIQSSADSGDDLMERARAALYAQGLRGKDAS